MENFMGNSMVHLVNFLLLGKKVMSKNVNVGVLCKTKFFMDGVLSVF